MISIKFVVLLAMIGGSVSIKLKPGETSEVFSSLIEVPQVAEDLDVVLLADSTGSMIEVMEYVKYSASVLLEHVLSLVPNAYFAVSSYSDFDFDPFVLQLPLGNDTDAIEAAIKSWTAVDGGDWNEAQFYALHKLAEQDQVNWRENSAKTIVWFGNSPGHPRICTAMNPTLVTENITETSLINELQERKIQVIAISLQQIDGYPSLDGKPDYLCNCFGTCWKGAGQATRISNATGGLIQSNVESENIVATIVNSIENLPMMVIPRCSCDVSELSCTTTPSTAVTVLGGKNITFTWVISEQSNSTRCGSNSYCTASFEIVGTDVVITDKKNVEFEDTISPIFTGEIIKPEQKTLTVQVENIPKINAVTAADNCDEQVGVEFTETRVITSKCIYQLLRSWRVEDAAGNKNEMIQNITVIDTEAPKLSSRLPTICLWPPNHKLWTFSLKRADSPFGFNLANDSNGVQIDFVSCKDEYGLRSAKPCTYDPINDKLQVVAERIGSGIFGAKISLQVKLADGCGNSITVSAVIRIPHSHGFILFSCDKWLHYKYFN